VRPDSGPLRLAFVCDEYPPGPHGGIGTCTQVLGRALAAAGHEVRAIGLYPSDYPAPDAEQDHGVSVIRLRQRTGRGMWVTDRHRLWLQIRDWARRGELDLIEVPDWGGPAAGWSALPIPVVARANGSVAFFAAESGAAPPRSVTALLERLSIRRADFWCASSRYTAERTRELFALSTGPGIALFNPVEAPPGDASETARRPGQVVFTGTLAEKKGVLSLAAAWPQVLREVSDARLDLYGKEDRAPDGGPMSAFLMAGLPPEAVPTVRWHGHVSREELRAALETAAVAVFPSLAETYGIAPFEAMAAGCPTIYTRRGPGPELLEHGRDALLVEPSRPEDVAAAIVRVLRDPVLARRLGEEGRRRVRASFSTATLLQENVAFYRDCIRRFAR
jgi:glycosyltransferase involved in cell wall biosynthesis